MSVPQQPQSLSTKNKPNRVYQVRGNARLTLSQPIVPISAFSTPPVVEQRAPLGRTSDSNSKKPSVSLHLLNAARIKCHLRLSGQARSESDASSRRRVDV